MQDEEMDNMDDLIREASNSYHPVYDDKAWDKMEVLLDKHLPNAGDRRKPIAFYLLFLFIGGAVFFTILYSWNSRDKQPAIENSKLTQAISTDKRSPVNQLDKTQPDQQSPGTTINNMANTNPVKNLQPAIKPLTGTKATNIANYRGLSREQYIHQKIQPTKNNELPGYAEKLIPGYEIALKPVYPISPATIPTTIQPGFKNWLEGELQLLKESRLAATHLPLPNSITGKEAGNSARSKAPSPKKGFANNFAVTLSAGPDLSFVQTGNLGKTNITYGAGLSYSFAKRFTVRSGIYRAKKIYTAGPADYHPPAGYWTYYANLERIDADCDIYEIPLTAGYQFSQSGKHNWFAAVGFSSFLMKRETYNYLYKNQQGQSVYRGWTLRNSNNHYFSVVTLSGGYQYNINNRVSLLAEPYLKLPLQGIGFGKIKLNGSGVLFTAAIKPFSKTRQ